MNKALLQTYVRSTLTPAPRTAEEITKIIQDKFPDERDVTVGRVAIILNQLHSAGLCRSAGPFGNEPQHFFTLR